MSTQITHQPHGVPRRVVALVLAAALLASGCTGDPGGHDSAGNGDPPPGGGSWTDVAVMDLTITGDIAHSTQLRSTTESLVLHEDADEARSAWASGVQAPPRVRLEDDRTRLTLAWLPPDGGAAGLSSVSLLLRVDEYLFVPRAGDCTFALRSGGTFMVRGTIECTQLTGVSGAAGDRPAIARLEAELTYHVPTCLTTATFITPSECRRIEP